MLPMKSNRSRRTALAGLWAFLLFFAGSVHSAAFDDPFTTNSGTTTSFTRSLGGVPFDFVFSSVHGDAGESVWESNNGPATQRRSIFGLRPTTRGPPSAS